MMRWKVGLLWLAMAVACGPEDRPAPSSTEDSSTGGSSTRRTDAGQSSDGTAGSAGSAGSAGADDQGGAGGADQVAELSGAGGRQVDVVATAGTSTELVGAAGSPALAPVVTITSPTAMASPDSREPHTVGMLEVLCVAKASDAAGAKGVDPSSVVVQLEDRAEVHEASAATATGNPDEFIASFAIGDFYASGPATITCAASDGFEPPRIGRDSIPIFIDLGPIITIESPGEGDAEPVNQTLRFRYTIEPDPLTDDDPESAVGEAHLVIRGNSFPLERDSDNPDSYFVDVDFTDPELFSESPAGELNVLIEASNSRAVPVTRSLQYTFTLDGTPPQITVESPANGSVVGGFVSLSFTVADDLSGVDKSTIVVRLNTDSHQYETSWGNGEPDYVFEFDSKLVSGSVMQVTVNIAASDNAGNSGEFGTSHVLYLDNQPPLVSLDPPNVRDRRYASPDYECSYVFDPVGNAAVNDESVLDASPRIFRALVWEETNVIGHPPYVYYSMTDQASVFLYLQPDPSEPLLVDTDGDDENLCDALAVESLDEAGNYVNLVPIVPAGTAYFGYEEFDPDPQGDPAPAGCVWGTAVDPPEPLCGRRSDMFRVTGQDIGGNLQPIVFGIGPLTAVDCTGTFWELAGLAPGRQGWMCLAARALDNVGNVGVSPPLRICYDNPNVAGSPDCTTPAPDCTDGCTAPDFVSRIIDI